MGNLLYYIALSLFIATTPLSLDNHSISSINSINRMVGNIAPFYTANKNIENIDQYVEPILCIL